MANTDTNFTWQFSPRTYDAIVQHRAVLSPLTGKLIKGTSIAARTERVVRIWRARLAELQEAGYNLGCKDLDKVDLKYVYCRNCCPSFTKAVQRTRPCHAIRLCPFCHARWVREIWKKFDGVFNAPDILLPGELDRIGQFYDPELSPAEDKPPDKFKYHLLERHHYFTRPRYSEDFDFYKYSYGYLKSTDAFLAFLLHRISENRGAVVDSIKTDAAFLYTTVAPYRDHYWRFHHRQLIRIPADTSIPQKLLDNTTRLRVHERPTRRVILEAVGRVCSYPRWLMFGPVDRAVQYLSIAADKRYRSSACYGKLRNSKFQD